MTSDHYSASASLRLVVELVHVLGDEAAQPARLLPPGQTEVVGVGQEGGPARPAYKVPGPVALSGEATLQEDFVLDWSLAGGGVQSHPLAPVVGDTTLSGDTLIVNSQESGNKTLSISHLLR